MTFAQTSGASLPAYPLKLSANHRYLVDQQDKPFLIVGDSPQGLVCMLSEADAERYFADRQAHGFNTAGWIDAACAGSDFPENKTGATYDGILPFTGFVEGRTDYGALLSDNDLLPFTRFAAEEMNYTDYDLSKPNEAYFARLDHMVQIAAKHGIWVFIDPAETNGWLQTLRNKGLAAAYSYGQYLGRRYKRYPNVGWICGNDFLNWRVPSDYALVQAVAKGIQSAAPDQLQSVEINYNTSWSLDDPSWAPILSLNSSYTYSATYIQMLHSYNQTPVMPTYLAEAHYDLEDVGTPSDYGTPEVLRRQEYWTMLSGGVGQFYGNHFTWSFPPGWDSHLDTVGVSQLTIWKDFFLSLAWQNLPYGTQMFFTCVACCRNHRPSACAGLNQSYSWPSLVHTCFMLPIDAPHKRRFLIAAEAPDGFDAVVLGQRLGQLRGLPATRFTTPPGRSLVSSSWYTSPMMSG
jgi:hypothetical protein